MNWADGCSWHDNAEVPTMMWDYGYVAWWMWIPGLLLPLLVIGGLAVAIVFSVRAIRTDDRHPGGAQPPAVDPARQLLEERLARGEITPEEFHGLLDTLRASRRAP